MPVYRTTFAVDASAARVREALTALDRYPEWNPQIPRISGRSPMRTATVRPPS